MGRGPGTGTGAGGAAGGRGGGRGTAGAQGSARGPTDQSAQNRAAEAVANGHAAPLGQVLALVRRNVPGEVLDVSLDEAPAGVWTYRLAVLTVAGDYCDVTVDARRNKLIQVVYR